MAESWRYDPEKPIGRCHFEIELTRARASFAVGKNILLNAHSLLTITMAYSGSSIAGSPLSSSIGALKGGGLDSIGPLATYDTKNQSDVE